MNARSLTNPAAAMKDRDVCSTLPRPDGPIRACGGDPTFRRGYIAAVTTSPV